MPIPINIDPNQQSRLWKRGLSLDEAWWQFGSRQYRQRYNSVQHAEMPKSVDEEAFSALNGVEKLKAATALVSERSAQLWISRESPTKCGADLSDYFALKSSFVTATISHDRRETFQFVFQTICSMLALLIGENPKLRETDQNISR